MSNKSILLESGTGELEAIVFKIGTSEYCINVLKAREIIDLGKVSSAISAQKEILGMTNVRGSILTVIDLKYVLTGISTDLNQKTRALICEFNGQQVIFTVDEVSEIKRIRWEDISPPSDLLKSSYIVGSIISGDSIYSLLDFEKIITLLEATNSSYVKEKEEIEPCAERGFKRIYIAEDSLLIRNTLKDMLQTAGYTEITVFENGKAALDAIMALKKHGKDFDKYIDLLITDIEMPLLDGHTLTRKIKEDDILKTLPVVIHSSLITDDLYHKGVSVGADKQISKPKIKELIAAVDSLILK